jgi:hypothetical protein
MSYLGMIFLLFTPLALAIDFTSGSNKTTVIELYTSEGCSSCPPADKWLSTLKQDPALFKDIIPMAFHVDYWDRLGWKDPWAKAAFSNRQRQLTRQDILSQVYTPGFVMGSQEWRSRSRTQDLSKVKPIETGVLSAQLNVDYLVVEYSKKGDYELNVAYLGMGLVSNVTTGENRFRKLTHDFVVLEHLKQKGRSIWHIELPNIPQQGQQQTAISVWLTKPGSLEIEQAASSYIDN